MEEDYIPKANSGESWKNDCEEQQTKKTREPWLDENMLKETGKREGGLYDEENINTEGLSGDHNPQFSLDKEERSDEKR